MEFAAIREEARRVRRRYEAYEQSRYGRTWSTTEIMLGLVGDTGDLAKLVQAAEGVRSRADLHEALGHELSDCLWSICVLADRLDVDLESAFGTTMAQIDARLDEAGVSR